jgi:hypothetical protein
MSDGERKKNISQTPSQSPHSGPATNIGTHDLHIHINSGVNCPPRLRVYGGGRSLTPY